MIIHTYDYDTNYDPAMPFIEIRTSRRAGQTSLTLKAIVDSGADATVIPLAYLQQLEARKVRTTWLRGITGGRYEVDLYTLVIQIGDGPAQYIEVVGSERQDEVIVGRDLLNEYVVTLNAPAHTVEVST